MFERHTSSAYAFLAVLLHLRTAQAFQSRMIDCGFKFIVPSLLVLAVSTIAAIIATISILASRDKQNSKIIKWWIVPPVSLALVIAFSYMCS